MEERESNTMQDTEKTKWVQLSPEQDHNLKVCSDSKLVLAF